MLVVLKFFYAEYWVALEPNRKQFREWFPNFLRRLLLHQFADILVGTEGGWEIEGGEEAYYEALEKSKQERLYDEDYLEDFYHISQELTGVGGGFTGG